MSVEKKVLTKTYCDVYLGYTGCSYRDQKVCLRHFTVFDQFEIDVAKEEFESLAKSKGVPTYQEKLAFIIKEGLWSEEQNKKITDLEVYVKNLRKSHINYFKKRDRDHIESLIKEKTKELNELSRNKEGLIGTTVENIADRRLNDFFVFKSFYKDKELLTPLFTDEEFEDLETFEIAELVSLYNEATLHLSSKCIKHLTVAPFFQNFFYLCGDNSYEFFNKPLATLTYQQNELLNYGKYYKSLFQEYTDMPDDVKNDPDKIADYIESAKKAKNLLDRGLVKSDKEVQSVFGLSAEDLKALDIEVTPDPAAKKLKESGKTHLNMQEIMALEGL